MACACLRSRRAWHTRAPSSRHTRSHIPSHSCPHTFSSLSGLQSHPGPAISLGHRRRRRCRPKARRRIFSPITPLRCRDSILLLLLLCCRVVLPAPGSGQAAPSRLAGAAVSRLPGTAPMYCPWCTATHALSRVLPTCTAHMHCICIPRSLLPVGYQRANHPQAPFPPMHCFRVLPPFTAPCM